MSFLETKECRNQCQVLVVEDNPDNRETLRLLLGLLGYRVDVACDGIEGVQKALQERPGVALVDIGLPGLDGYQVARKLRAGLGRNIFLIAQTAYDQPEDRDRALSAGFDVHLSKPVGVETLTQWLTQGGIAPEQPPRGSRSTPLRSWGDRPGTSPRR